MTFDHSDPKPGALRRSPAQLEPIEDFFGFSPGPGFTDDQAHALLTYRDYASDVVMRAYPRIGGGRRFMPTRFVAAFVGSDHVIRRDVQRWANRRWLEAAGSDTIVSAVERTKHLVAVTAFLRAALNDLRDAGSAAF